MNKDFSIYNSPFSEETRKIRLNCLLPSGLCLFIGLTGELPERFSLLGISFSTEQQTVVGWFIFAISLYIYIHFVSVASIEIAKWIHPFFKDAVAKRELLKHPAFDETDFIDIPYPIDEHDKGQIAAQATDHADWRVQRKLRPLYGWVYPKLVLEIAVPYLFGLSGLVMLGLLITSKS